MDQRFTFWGISILNHCDALDRALAEGRLLDVENERLRLTNWAISLLDDLEDVEPVSHREQAPGVAI
jgi:hypothetical protein